MGGMPKIRYYKRKLNKRDEEKVKRKCRRMGLRRGGRDEALERKEREIKGRRDRDDETGGIGIGGT